MAVTNQHTTNYTDAFIAVAEDTKAEEGKAPPTKDAPTVAQLHYELLAAQPYALTSDDLLFAVHARREGIAEDQLEVERARFFAKGQPCLRSSPLSKTYGWGTHHDAEGKVALYAVGSPEYERLSNDPNVRHVRAMRSSRAK